MCFWHLMLDLSRDDGVTIFISTHFRMNEALRCDRISLMHAGRVLDSDTPQALMDKVRPANPGSHLYRLPEAVGEPAPASGHRPDASSIDPPPRRRRQPAPCFSRIPSREALELRRDPIRGIRPVRQPAAAVHHRLRHQPDVKTSPSPCSTATNHHQPGVCLSLATARAISPKAPLQMPTNWNGACNVRNQPGGGNPARFWSTISSAAPMAGHVARRRDADARRNHQGLCHGPASPVTCSNWPPNGASTNSQPADVGRCATATTRTWKASMPWCRR